MLITTIPFYLLTTFSAKADGGNPAAVVFMDLTRSIEVYGNIAHNFNQPITTFLSPLASTGKALSYNVRWFAPNRRELKLCGHGALAAAQTVFESDATTRKIETIEFHTLSGEVVTARKCEGGYIELHLTPAKHVAVSPEERSRLQNIITRSFGREPNIKFMACGDKGYEQYLMVELDDREDLESLLIEPNTLRDSGYLIHIFTVESRDGTEAFVSRMFAPGLVPGGEDHVCGSAHCIITPYWYERLGISRGHEIYAKQVSPRGGELRLLWEADQDILRLRGATRILAKGELQIP